MNIIIIIIIIIIIFYSPAQHKTRICQNAAREANAY